MRFLSDFRTAKIAKWQWFWAKSSDFRSAKIAKWQWFWAKSSNFRNAKIAKWQWFRVKLSVSAWLKKRLRLNFRKPWENPQITIKTKLDFIFPNKRNKTEARNRKKTKRRSYGAIWEPKEIIQGCMWDRIYDQIGIELTIEFQCNKWSKRRGYLRACDDISGLHVGSLRSNFEIK